MPSPALQHVFCVDEHAPGLVLRALRHWLPHLSWSKLRALLASRRVTVNQVLCLHEGRTLQPGDVIEVLVNSLPAPPDDEDVRIVYRDRDVAVVEKPPGMVSLRHRCERGWHASKKRIQPALEEAVGRLLGNKDKPIRVHSVHRIDRDTSGLLVFALHSDAQRLLISQFVAHTTVRAYRVLIPGTIPNQTIRSSLVRDRGDGLRGSVSGSGGKEAITHMRTLRHLTSTEPPPDTSEAPVYSEIECRLHTGRTHQIRIHLAERGRPVCGDPMYRGPLGMPPLPDTSGVPRLALHAAELEFVHPRTGKPVEFASAWAPDIEPWLQRWSSVAAVSDASAAPPTSPTAD